MADTEKTETKERLKKAYELGRECGEYVAAFDYDPNEDTETAMQNYVEFAGFNSEYEPHPACMFIDGTEEVDPDAELEWKRGFADGYEATQGVEVTI